MQLGGWTEVGGANYARAPVFIMSSWQVHHPEQHLVKKCWYHDRSLKCTTINIWLRDMEQSDASSIQCKNEQFSLWKSPILVSHASNWVQSENSDYLGKGRAPGFSGSDLPPHHPAMVTWTWNLGTKLQSNRRCVSQVHFGLENTLLKIHLGKSLEIKVWKLLVIAFRKYIMDAL